MRPGTYNWVEGLFFPSPKLLGAKSGLQLCQAGMALALRLPGVGESRHAHLQRCSTNLLPSEGRAAPSLASLWPQRVAAAQLSARQPSSAALVGLAPGATAPSAPPKAGADAKF